MRIRALALATVLVLTASGCATSSFGDEPGKTLTVLTHYGSEPHKSGLKKLVDEWNRTHPEVQVKTQSVLYNELLQTVTARHASGQTPDIINAYSLWGGQLAAADVLDEPPTDVATDIRDEYSPAASEAVTVDDQVLGYPTEMQTYALIYNKKLLAKAGVTEPPKTWDELEDIAERTTVTDDSGNLDVAGFGLTTDFSDTAVVHPFASLLQAAGGRYMNADGSAAFDSKAGQRALSLQKQLVESGSADPGLNTIKAFPSNRVAMTINAGYWIGVLKGMMGDDYENVGVAPIPGPKAGDKGSLAYGFFTGVSSHSDQKDDAWEFLRWLNAEQAADGATRMGAFQFGAGSIPARVSDSEALTADDPNFEPFVQAMDYALPEPNPRGGQQMKTALQGSIQSVWTGDLSVAEALRSAAAEADATLNQD
ncbi:ABC transporter substrate-binding protein [Stackebrandtia nassauensis]|uniref:Extracellular solute-binding protein family 1 n=1 Tax=Stackebrandtia nassauensis (strain DSM 44728 / CIP 108903 / NRRL B-16338 / NBRC 102104 / LLR-40K-21) TaxID=446470 RepID=D3Q7G3_STANL|nr:ABC transporter substrate-binding protein [Stackebrandtia nassauensis]ADD42434.1 extracellular solute-binding protein family 1 [Stackebrandtia nassauensis DSM 44728]